MLAKIRDVTRNSKKRTARNPEIRKDGIIQTSPVIPLTKRYISIMVDTTMRSVQGR